jgi:hypothetical protein
MGEEKSRGTAGKNRNKVVVFTLQGMKRIEDTLHTAAVPSIKD